MFFQLLNTQRVFYAIAGDLDHQQPLSYGTVIVPQLSRAKRLNRFVKRIVDIILSGAALALLWPFLIMLIMAIKIESPGPAIFMQWRWGQGGTTFRVFKFRTMYYSMCDDVGARQAIKNDPRVTVLGHFLRRTNIDELPQLLNVLRGEMSLVGPRCHPVKMYAGGVSYEDLVPSYHRRHAVKPGLTGLAQINNLRGPTTDPQKAKMRIVHDRLYVIKNDIWLDFKIMAATLVQELRGGVGF